MGGRENGDGFFPFLTPYWVGYWSTVFHKYDTMDHSNCHYYISPQSTANRKNLALVKGQIPITTTADPAIHVWTEQVRSIPCSFLVPAGGTENPKKTALPSEWIGSPVSATDAPHW